MSKWKNCTNYRIEKCADDVAQSASFVESRKAICLFEDANEKDRASEMKIMKVRFTKFHFYAS